MWISKLLLFIPILCMELQSSQCEGKRTQAILQKNRYRSIKNETRVPCTYSDLMENVYIEMVQKLCVAEIQNGHFNYALREYLVIKDNPLVLTNITKRAYENKVYNTRNILKFTDRLVVNEKIEVLTALFEEMVRNQHLHTHQIFIIASKIHTIIKSLPLMKEHLQAKFAPVLDNLPPVVKYILGGTVCVRTDYFSSKYEYLIAESDNHLYDKRRRFVLTLRGNRNSSVDSAKTWKFEPKYGGRFFAIKNIMYDEYMYAAANDLTFDHSRRRIFTWRQKMPFDTSEWEIMPVRDGMAITIRQRFLFEYLYPLDGDELTEINRRYVFTWRDVREKPWSTQYDWLIDQC